MLRTCLASGAFLTSLYSMACCQSPERDSIPRGIDGDYEKISGGSYRSVMEMGIHGSAIVYKTTTFINPECRDITLRKFRFRPVRDDIYILTEESYDSYEIKENGMPDRRPGWKIDGPKSMFKTIKATGQGGIVEGMADVLLGRNPSIQGRWVWKYDYGRGPASTPESTVIEISDRRLKSVFSMSEKILEYPVTIRADTLYFHGKDGTVEYAKKYRISNDTLFLVLIAPSSEYARRNPGNPGSESAK